MNKIINLKENLKKLFNKVYKILIKFNKLITQINLTNNSLIHLILKIIKKIVN